MEGSLQSASAISMRNIFRHAVESYNLKLFSEQKFYIYPEILDFFPVQLYNRAGETSNFLNTPTS